MVRYARLLGATADSFFWSSHSFREDVKACRAEEDIASVLNKSMAVVIRLISFSSVVQYEFFQSLILMQLTR